MFFCTGTCPRILVQISVSAYRLRSVPTIESYAGNYTIRNNSTINGRENWVSADGKYVIWFEGNTHNGMWKISEISKRDDSVDLLKIHSVKMSLKSPGDIGAQLFHK